MISTWRMWMHSGSTCGEKDSIQRVRKTPPGASGIFICPIRMATSCRSRVRSSSLSAVARTHQEREEACEDTCATLVGAGFVRDEVPGMKQDSGYVLGS